MFRKTASVLLQLWSLERHKEEEKTEETPRPAKVTSELELSSDWDSGVCVLSHFSHVQLFATLWTIAHQAFLSVEFSRQE